MLGKPDDEGIIPRACKQIFKKIQNEPEENTTYEVFATMVELYNEKIYDLFNPTKTSLKVITVENRTEIQGVYKFDIILFFSLMIIIEHLVKIMRKLRTC